MTFKSHIIVPNTGNRRHKTVNVVTSTAGYQQGEVGTFREGTNCETVQDSGGLVKGLPTICVPGYSGGGGGSSYAAKAVHFDGNVFFRTESLIAPGDNTGFCSFHYWFNFNGDPTGYIFAVDPDNTYTSNGWTQSVGATQWVAHNQFCSVDDSHCWNADPLPAEGSYLTKDANWHSIAGSVKTNLSAGNKIFNLYIDDAVYPVVAQESGNSGAFTLTFNGLPLSIFDDGFGDGAVADFADFWFAPGQYIDWPLQVNRRKFRNSNGKPVDLGSDGSTPTGVAPAVFFSGNSTDFGNNKGLGGALAKHGSGSLTNAGTSPSD